MPDKRQHRGPHPSDEKLFAPTHLPALRAAVAQFSWLLSRGYAPDSSLKLVGNRHDLTARQRTAVMRSACSDDALLARRGRIISLAPGAPPDDCPSPLAIDGYNLLITIESALSGGVLLVGRDGCVRDLASVHGTYRHVRETEPALALILDELSHLPLSQVTWYFDRPVSNSGRLRARLTELIASSGQTPSPFQGEDRGECQTPSPSQGEGRGEGPPKPSHDRQGVLLQPLSLPGRGAGGEGPSPADGRLEGDPPRMVKSKIPPAPSSGETPASVAARICAIDWHVELVPSPDKVLIEAACPVVSSDSAVLDRCGPWLNLAADLIRRRAPDAWIVDLRDHDAPP